MTCITYYHTSKSRECTGVNGEALQLRAVYKKLYFYYKSHENPYQVLRATWKLVSILLQVTWELYQVLQVTWAASECAMKSKVLMIKIIINIVQTYTKKNITRLLPLTLLLMLYTRNNTDGNKFIIFSSIALYYSETYMQTVWASP